MENTSLTPKQKQQEIDNEVMNYAWKLWNNEAEIAYIFNDVQTKALKGGLNYDLKTKLSDQLVKKIKNYELKIFFEWYSKKSQRDAEKLAQDMRDKIAADLAEEVKITFKDPTRKAGKKSVLKNWIVRWKNIPKKIKDKKNLKLKVKSDGMAQTYHTVYAAVAYGIKPVVNICTPKGKVVDTQTMVFKSRSNTYNLMTKKVKGYLKSHKCKLNKTKLTLTAGGKYTLKLTNAKASKVKWKTSNKRVATVKNGKIKAKKKGSATITAIYKKKKYRCKLTVKASAKKKTNYWKYAGSYTKDMGANTPVNVEVGSCTKTVDKTISASNGVFNIKTVTNALEGSGSGSWGDAAHEGLCKNETASATFTFSALPKSYKLDQKVNLTLRGTFNQSKPMCYNDGMSNLTCSSYITTVNPSANPIPASNWYITGHTFGSDMDCHVLSQSKTVSGAVSVPGYLDQLKSGDVFYVVEYAYAGGDRDKYGAYYVIHKYQWVGKK
ncbi:MAG: Ig-like domain-containing protein [Ruminococcus sp.]|nr:Ig-like domain-containing protein [Ruminococcus sp.]